MRNIQAQRKIPIDPRQESINRVNQKPADIPVYRKDTGASTVKGGRKEYFVGLFKGRVDILSMYQSGYRVQGVEQAGLERARLEVPYPTDERGITVDIKRDDRVVYNGVSFNVTDAIIDDGYIVAGMEILR